jgi:hypothetical protein
MNNRLFPAKCYEITIESMEEFKKNRAGTDALIPRFTVNLTHSITCTDLEKFDEQCVANPIAGFSYQREIPNKITISIALSENHLAQNEIFRKAVGIHTRYLLQSSDLDAIFKRYTQHVEDSKKALNVLKDFKDASPSHKFHSHSSPTHNQAH